VVGLVASVERGRWGVWEEVCDQLPRSYSTAVQRAGGLALLIPPDAALADEPDAALDVVDSLLLSGGSDVDPATYGARPHPRSKPTYPLRDQVEASLARRAIERDTPVLGVCRGMQMLNVALGGTLEQHLADRIGSERHSHTPGSYGDHEVRLAQGSLAARAAGEELHTVKSHHHQGVDRVGEGLEVTGWSVDDDVVEAIELSGQGFALGVLWHPEEDERSRVISMLVSEAATRAIAR